MILLAVLGIAFAVAVLMLLVDCLCEASADIEWVRGWFR